MADDMDTPMDPAGDPVGGAPGGEEKKTCPDHPEAGEMTKEEYDKHMAEAHGGQAAPGADTPSTPDVPPQ